MASVDVASGLFWAQLPGQINPMLAYLCANVSTSASHSGETFSLSFGVASPAAEPAILWSGIPETPLAPGSTLPEITFSYESSSYDSAEDALHLQSINATLNHNVTGTITGVGSTLNLAIAITTYMEVNDHLLGSDAASSSANIIDRRWSTSYDLVDSYGEYEANPSTASETNDPQDLDFSQFARIMFQNDNFEAATAAVRAAIPDIRPGYADDLASAFQSAMYGGD